MSRIYLGSLGLHVDAPEGTTYVNLGWTDNLEARIEQFEKQLGIKSPQRRKGISGNFFVAGSALKYRDRKGNLKFATVYANPAHAAVDSLLRDYYRVAVSAHEEAHIASMTGNRKDLEVKYGLRLRGKSEEDVANLTSLAVLDRYASSRGRTLEGILYSRGNPGGIMITDSTKKPSIRVQLRYHNRILKEYCRQKRRQRNPVG